MLFSPGLSVLFGDIPTACPTSGLMLTLMETFSPISSSEKGLFSLNPHGWWMEFSLERSAVLVSEGMAGEGGISQFYGDDLKYGKLY